MMVFIVLLGSALMVSERIPGVRFRDLPPLRPHLATDALYLLTGFVLLGLLTEALVMRAATLSGSLTGIADLWPVAPGIVQIACALVMIDLGNYVAHWCLHRVDSLWELHKVHHSSPTLDVMATFRSHVGEQLVRRVLAPAGVVMAGMPMNAVLAASGRAMVFIRTAVCDERGERVHDDSSVSRGDRSRPL